MRDSIILLTKKNSDDCILGWCSNIKDKEIYGWLLNENEFNDFRKGYIRIGDINIRFLANKQRASPKRFKDHKFNGFRVKLSEDQIAMIQHESKIELFDEQTNRKIYECIL